MTQSPRHLLRLSGGASSDDGKRVRFRVETADGGAVDLECGHSDIEAVVHFMVGLGGLAAEKRAEVTPHAMGGTDRVEISPISVSDLGFMQELGATETVLVVRMFGFDLGFSLTPGQIAGLKAEFDRIMPGGAKGHDHHHHH